MSHHHHSDYVEVISAKGPTQLSGRMKGIFITMAIVGIAAFALGLLVDQKAAWIAYLHNFYFFTGLAAGGLVVAAIIQVARAMWGRPIKRFGEAFGAFLPLTIILLLPLWFFGAEHLYEWDEWPEMKAQYEQMDSLKSQLASASGEAKKELEVNLNMAEAWESVEHKYHHKVWWLQRDFVFGRVLIYLILLTLLGIKFMNLSRRPDLGLANEKNPDLWPQPAGWGDLDAEVGKAQAGMSKWGVLYCFAFAFLISMVSYDLIMSLDFRWFSTMFGGWNFTSYILISWGTLYLVATNLGDSSGLSKYFHKLIYHDLGKLVFGFTVVWGYLFFAQLMVIWYGNLSHESGYLITRIHHDVWAKYGWTAAVMVFAIPFVLGLGKKRKMKPKTYSVVILISIMGLWLERFVLIAPASWHYIRTPGEGEVAGYQPGVEMLLGLDLVVFLGFLGIFCLVVSRYLFKLPLMVISDPRLDEGVNRH
ncbi:MAG: hypothetical protein QNK37_09255 [Acidobacteriota bacterium]|nr:hypothetical protein [Acidobacteriota bacterium]